MLTPDFSKPEDRERYEAFMDELVELIVDKYDGSLKAEHGTGVNMAPFVEREWGAKATELMWRVKELADPDGVLGPGRRAQPRPGRPPAQPEDDAADRGGRRPPASSAASASRSARAAHLTTTPRQRIVLRREMARQPAGSPVREALLEQYEYDGIETCAADGTCALACPLGIDTGKLVKELRAARAHRRARSAVALRLAERWDRGRARGARRACAPAGAARGAPRSAAAAGAARAASATSWCPRGRAKMPPPGAARAARRPRARAPPPSTCRPASTGSSAGPARRERRGRACPRRWSRSRRAPGCRCGSPPTSPATAARRRGPRRATARARD